MSNNNNSEQGVVSSESSVTSDFLKRLQLHQSSYSINIATSCTDNLHCLDALFSTRSTGMLHNFSSHRLSAEAFVVALLYYIILYDSTLWLGWRPMPANMLHSLQIWVLSSECHIFVTMSCFCNISAHVYDADNITYMFKVFVYSPEWMYES